MQESTYLSPTECTVQQSVQSSRVVAIGALGELKSNNPVILPIEEHQLSDEGSRAGVSKSLSSKPNQTNSREHHCSASENKKASECKSILPIDGLASRAPAQ